MGTGPMTGYGAGTRSYCRCEYPEPQGEDALFCGRCRRLIADTRSGVDIEADGCPVSGELYAIMATMPTPAWWGETVVAVEIPKEPKPRVKRSYCMVGRPKKRRPA